MSASILPFPAIPQDTPIEVQEAPAAAMGILDLISTIAAHEHLEEVRPASVYHAAELALGILESTKPKIEELAGLTE